MNLRIIPSWLYHDPLPLFFSFKFPNLSSRPLASIWSLANWAGYDSDEFRTILVLYHFRLSLFQDGKWWKSWTRSPLWWPLPNTIISKSKDGSISHCVTDIAMPDVRIWCVCGLLHAQRTFNSMSNSCCWDTTMTLILCLAIMRICGPSLLPVCLPTVNAPSGRITVSRGVQCIRTVTLSAKSGCWKDTLKIAGSIHPRCHVKGQLSDVEIMCRFPRPIFGILCIEEVAAFKLLRNVQVHPKCGAEPREHTTRFTSISREHPMLTDEHFLAMSNVWSPVSSL